MRRTAPVMATFRSIHLLLVAAALMAALLPPNVCAQDEGAYEDDSGVSDPVVTSLSASSGAMTGGTRLELNGDNFGVPVPLGPPVNEVVLVTADGGQRPCIVEQFSSRRQDRLRDDALGRGGSRRYLCDGEARVDRQRCRDRFG